MLFKNKDLLLCLVYFCVLNISCFVRLFCFNCRWSAHFIIVSDTILWFKSVWSFNILNFEIINSAGRTCDFEKISPQWSNWLRMKHTFMPQLICRFYVVCLLLTMFVKKLHWMTKETGLKIWKLAALLPKVSGFLPDIVGEWRLPFFRTTFKCALIVNFESKCIPR